MHMVHIFIRQVHAAYLHRNVYRLEQMWGHLHYRHCQTLPQFHCPRQSMAAHHFFVLLETSCKTNFLKYL